MGDDAEWSVREEMGDSNKKEGVSTAGAGWSVEETPKLLSRCFMSEKWCMGEKDILNYWNTRREENRNGQAFVIMTYSEDSNLIYENQIKPMLANLDYPLSPKRADTVTRTGYIICQKICRPILMADLVVAEVTKTTKNVLYELGFSAALERKVLLLADSAENEPEIKKLFEDWKLEDEEKTYLSYDRFQIMDTSKEELETKLWKVPRPPAPQSRSTGKIGILGPSNTLFHNGAAEGPGNGAADDAAGGPTKDAAESAKTNKAQPIQLIDALKSQIANSLRDAICRIKGYNIEDEHEGYLRKRRFAQNRNVSQKARKEFLDNFTAYLTNPDSVDQRHQNDKAYFSWMHVRSMRTDENDFRTISAFIESCEYILIDITGPEDLQNKKNYFWIGYCHGRGKKVIPVQVKRSEGDADHSAPTSFDIQGLYNFVYDTRHPQTACDEFACLLSSSLFEKELTEEARNTFWAPFFEEPELKIFVGASTDCKKYFLNEWDYLTLAELHRYLSEAKPTLQNQIISPIYQQPTDLMTAYLQEPQNVSSFFERHIKDCNCIIIGSADVNILTEMVLAKALDVEPFNPEVQKDFGFSGCVTEKKDGKRSLIFRNDHGECPFEQSCQRDKHVADTRRNRFTFCNVDSEDSESEQQHDKKTAPPSIIPMVFLPILTTHFPLRRR